MVSFLPVYFYNLIFELKNLIDKIILSQPQLGVHATDKRVDIDHDITRSPKVFAYEYQPTLRRLKAAHSIEACLYLALLHAATAQPLADPFTGLTGTEMALHLLPPNSASTWSCKPLSDTSLSILSQLATLSPVRKFYPAHLHSMQVVSWPLAMSESNAHEAFHLIAAKLVNDSERLAFAFPVTHVGKFVK